MLLVCLEKFFLNLEVLVSLHPPLNVSWPLFSGRFSLRHSLDLWPFKCQKGNMINCNCDMDSCPSRASLRSQRSLREGLSYFTHLSDRNCISVISNQKMKFFWTHFSICFSQPWKCDQWCSELCFVVLSLQKLLLYELKL